MRIKRNDFDKMINCLKGRNRRSSQLQGGEATQITMAGEQDHHQWDHHHCHDSYHDFRHHHHHHDCPDDFHHHRHHQY